MSKTKQKMLVVARLFILDIGLRINMLFYIFLIHVVLRLNFLFKDVFFRNEKKFLH